MVSAPKPVNTWELHPLIKERRDGDTGMTMADEILRVEDLHVSVDETPILNGMSLTINRGEIHVIR